MSAAGEPDSLAAARAEVRRTREELGDTVEALAYKADVKARARDRVEEIRTQAAEKAGAVTAQAAEKAGVVRAGEPPTQLIAAAAIGLAIVAVVLWRRGSR